MAKHAKYTKYGIIYNRDGGPHGCSEVPQSMEAFLEKVYPPLEDTQVGALFWCVGIHSAHWNSDVLELRGDVHGRRYESADAYTSTENVRQMLERGEDAQEALIERGHQLGLDVYASVRMNDNHFNGAQVEDLAKMYGTGLTRMRIEHPEWLLGDQTSEWFALSWNLAVPEVREHRFLHIKEICQLYDWDGIELDWQRHAFHFPEDDAYRLRYLLTDLQRAVRRMADDIAKERGRPFYVAARVAGTLEMCRNIGYDIPTWIDEGLLDIIIPAGGGETDPALDVAAFVQMCRGTDIAVYPGFDCGLPEPSVGPEDAGTKDRMRTRAIASRYHRAGADGIYVFNWGTSRPELLCQVGSYDTLRGKDRIYAAAHRFIKKEGQWRGAFRIDCIWGEVPVALKRTLTDGGPTITLNVADDLSADVPESVELRVRLDQWVKGDVVHVFWDGSMLEDLHTSYSSPDDISDVSDTVWLCCQMDPSKVAVGPHKVKVTLAERNPKMACDIVLTDVELVIRYPN